MYVTWKAISKWYLNNGRDNESYENESKLYIIYNLCVTNMWQLSIQNIANENK